MVRLPRLLQDCGHSIKPWRINNFVYLTSTEVTNFSIAITRQRHPYVVEKRKNADD
jgi:hypothetical protein